LLDREWRSLDERRSTHAGFAEPTPRDGRRNSARRLHIFEVSDVLGVLEMTSDNVRRAYCGDPATVVVTPVIFADVGMRNMLGFHSIGFDRYRPNDVRIGRDSWLQGACRGRYAPLALSAG